jgi:hypothetical protein
MVMSTPVHAEAGETERAAGRRASSWARSLEADVLRLVVAAEVDGVTALEARVALNIPVERHYSVAPRLSALKAKGWVEPSGLSRENYQAYVATDAGRAQVRA